MKHIGLIVSIIFIFLFGVVIGKMGSPKAVESSAPKSLDFGEIEVGTNQNNPRIELLVTKNPVDGYDLNLRPDNFVFAPSRVGAKHSKGEGHARLYVDGQLNAIIVSNWYHLQVSEGEHLLRVTLNANSGEALSVYGNVVEDQESIGP